MTLKTALYEEHVKLQGRMVDFAGWNMPVQYTGVMDEHLACRESVGLFDVSHMGEFHVEGPDAQKFLNEVITNDLGLCEVGQAQYTVMCHPQGGIVDDLVIYKRAADRFLVVVNAANTEKDFAWMSKIFKSNPYNAKLTNESAHYSQIAIQGRNAERILQLSSSVELKNVGTYKFKEGFFGSERIPCIFARTGYTGEDGFEVYVDWSQGPLVWKKLMADGASLGIKACGLAARDTLRLEMKYPLYGNELNDETNPLDAGLGWVVKLDKPSFVGKDALVAVKAAGIKRKLVGIQLIDRGVPRSGYSILDPRSGKSIGLLTSGNQSPSLKLPIGVGYVDSSMSNIGTEVQIEIRGTPIKAIVVKTPFYKKPY